MTTTPFKYLVEAVQQKEKELKKKVGAQLKSAPVVHVNYDLSSVRALGTYQLMRGHIHMIRLNGSLLNELKEKYINEVFVHEYAHACVEHFYGSSYQRVMPHGKEFKAFCRMLGCTPAATTGIARDSKVLKERAKTGNRFIYMCDCQEFALTATRHNKIVSGVAKYKCRKCGCDLKKK